MQTKNSLLRFGSLIVLGLITALLAGCASGGGGKSTSGQSAAGQPAGKFQADDKRVIDIGRASAVEGGTTYKNPHLEKCWVAAGFDFKGYDTLYIAPTRSTAKFPEKPEDTMVHDKAKESLVAELARSIQAKNLFRQVVTKESDIPAGSKTLRLENTITEFSKGGGAARYFAGLYGGGQPVLGVEGVLSDGGRPVFTYMGRRSGVSGGARLTGAFMKDEDIQIQDVRSLALDLTDFMAAIAGKYAPRS
jgi:hypothetical protein